VAVHPDPLSSIVARLSEAWEGLPDKPEETPESTARALWFLAAGAPRSVARVPGDLPHLTSESAERLEALVAARLSGVPLAYLTGRQSFMGLELLAEPHAMVPRRETELLGAKALECLRALLANQDHARVLDICTGSGNLAVALAVHEPRCTVFGSDLMPEAVSLARRNAELHRLGDRVRFFVGDLFEAFETPAFLGAVDLVVCNPPYITSAKVGKLPREIGEHEPRAAFDGGPLGVGIILRLMKIAPLFLRPGSHLCFEVGVGQGEHVLRLLERSPRYGHVEGVPDQAGWIRVVAARTAQPGPPGVARASR
jgi:release factor glutamine methyltransferase